MYVLILYCIPYESAVFAFVGMSGECSYANKIVKSAFVQCVIVNPHSLKMQIQRREFENTIIFPR